MEGKREQLAEYAHVAWSGWMKYLFEKSTLNHDGTITIPGWAVERWTKQSNTKYTELSEGEKESDRHEANRMLAIIKSVNGKDNLIKALAELIRLRDNYRIGMEEYHESLNKIIRWVEECLPQREDGKR